MSYHPYKSTKQSEGFSLFELSLLSVAFFLWFSVEALAEFLASIFPRLF